MIDLDATTEIGEDRGTKYSEAFLSPELMQTKLPTRVSGRPVKGQATIAAYPSQDVW